MASVQIRFMSLDASFKTVREQKFPTFTDAVKAVKAYAEQAGFTNVVPVEDSDGWRFTARTPNGRSGRNVAYGEYDIDE